MRKAASVYRLPSSPKTEAEIIAVKPGWAEQDPGNWWENLKLATQAVLAESGVNAEDIKAIGISYQMHGLVCVDKNQQVLRPAIIWCDSRAVPYGQKAFETLGEETCLSHLLNSPATSRPPNWLGLRKMSLPFTKRFIR